MHVTKISVTAGRTLPHPTESFANVRSDVTLEAVLDPEESHAEATKRLQLQAEQLVEQHAQLVIASIEQRDITIKEQAEISRLTSTIEQNQQRLEVLQKNQSGKQTLLPLEA